MHLHPGIEILEISAEVMGNPTTLYPTLIWDDETVLLVDAGFPGQLPLFRQAIERAGVPFERLNTILLTHHDIDHIGGLAELRAATNGRARILAHEVEKAYIQGELPPLKLAQAQAMGAALPPERRAFFEMMRTAFENSRVPVDETLVDGQRRHAAARCRWCSHPGTRWGTSACTWKPAGRWCPATRCG